MLAGLGASTVHLVLMELKHRAGILPAFDPYADLQRMLSSFSSLASEAPWSWLLPYVNGSMLLGFLFGQSFLYLPGRTAWARGSVFGLLAWLVLGLGLLPLAGSGMFARNLGLGIMPALLMLGMLSIYGVALSLLYGWLMETELPSSSDQC